MLVAIFDIAFITLFGKVLSNEFPRYNSAVFSTIVANEYMVVTAPESFIKSGIAKTVNVYETLNHYFVYNDFERSVVNSRRAAIGIFNHLNTMERLENEDCIREYSQEFLSRRRDVVLVSETACIYSEEVIRYNISTTDDHTGSNSHSWIDGTQLEHGNERLHTTLCGNPSDTIATNTSEWGVYWNSSVKVKYCLSQQVDEQCEVHFSIQIMIVVILCNFVKAISMLMVLFVYKKPPLITMGDAVASFLNSQDVHTQGRCLTSVADCRSKNHSGFDYSWPLPRCTKWHASSRRWLHGASETRWMTCNFL